MSIACLVHDDRRPARDLISRMLAAVPAVHRVVALPSADELIHRVTGEPGEVAVIGTRRADRGEVDALLRVLTTRPGVSIVVVGSRDDASAVRTAVAHGARAFLRWDASPDVVETVLHAVVGVRSASLPRSRPGVAGTVSPQARDGGAPDRGFLGDVSTQRAVQVRLRISPREMQVLRGISDGMSNGEIGRELYLSDNTVKSHARRLFGKLEVHERAHAVARAYRLGLFEALDEARTGAGGQPGDAEG